MSTLPQKSTSGTPITAPRSSQPEPKKKSKRRVALVAAVLLVLGVFAVQSLIPAFGGSESTSAIDPETYVGDAVEGMSYVPSVDPDAAIAKARNAVDDAESQARVRLADEVALVEGAAAGVTPPSSLPPLPPGYRPGMDVSGFVGPQLPPEPFAVPDLSPGLGSVDLETITWKASESPVVEEPWAPRTGVPQLDEHADKVESARTTVEDALDKEEVELVWDTLAAAGVPVPREVQDPVSPGGVLNPNEEGAHAAEMHAVTMLGNARGTLGQLDGQLDTIEAAHEDLVATVDDVVGRAPAVLNETRHRLDGQLQERLAMVESEAQRSRDRVEGDIEAYRQHVMDTRDGLGDDLDAVLDAELERLRAVGAEQSEYLERQAGLVREESDRAVADIEQGRDEAIATLEEVEDDTGKDMGRMKEILHTASQAAIAEVRVEAADQEDRLRAEAERLRADVEARAERLRTQVSDARADAEARLDDALTDVEAVRSYALQRIDAIRARKATDLTQLHSDTLQRFERELDAHVQHVLRRAWEVNEDSRAVLDGTDVLVDGLRTMVDDEVDQDIAYILKVAEDYRQVPTPEREEAAEAWEDVAGLLGGAVVNLTQPGGDADDVLVRLTEIQMMVEAVTSELEMRGADAL